MSLDFPTLCFPITMNWGMGKLKLSTCPLAGFCWTLFLPINLSMFAFYTTLKQEERSWQLWIKKLINMLTVKFQLAGLPCHPVLLWLHISSSTNAFSFRSTTIRSSRVHHGFTTTSEKKTVGSWNWFYLGFTWFTWFTIDSKISTSPWLCCIFALRWNGPEIFCCLKNFLLSIVVKMMEWTNTKNKNPQRPNFHENRQNNIIDPNIPSAWSRWCTTETILSPENQHLKIKLTSKIQCCRSLTSLWPLVVLSTSTSSTSFCHKQPSHPPQNKRYREWKWIQYSQATDMAAKHCTLCTGSWAM